MAYVLRRIFDGKYLAPLSGKEIYTPSIAEALIFETRQEAEREMVVDLELVLEA